MDNTINTTEQARINTMINTLSAQEEALIASIGSPKERAEKNRLLFLVSRMDEAIERIAEKYSNQ